MLPGVAKIPTFPILMYWLIQQVRAITQPVIWLIRFEIRMQTADSQVPIIDIFACKFCPARKSYWYYHCLFHLFVSYITVTSASFFCLFVTVKTFVFAFPELFQFHKVDF